MKKCIQAQKNELTEYHIYNKLAQKTKNKRNAEILKKIAKEEKRHEQIWAKHTNVIVKPYHFKIWRYTYIASIFWLTFGIKLMEYGEKKAQINYDEIAKVIPEAQTIKEDEHQHENDLIKMIDEKILHYIGSIVLGLNDALVELTGVLAGLTLGLQNGKLIAIVGLITGISASFSMAGSEYLSVKTEEWAHPIKSACYTGIAYITTVIALILPYFLVNNVFLALGLTISVAIMIIFVFNFYVSIAKDYPFKQRFREMVAISMGVASISFWIGFLIRTRFGVEI